MKDDPIANGVMFVDNDNEYMALSSRPNMKLSKVIEEWVGKGGDVRYVTGYLYQRPVAGLAAEIVRI